MIEVLQAGVQTSVQDAVGRPGWRHLGVTPGGASDAAALELANALVGNPPGAAGLEVWQGPLRLRLHGRGWLAVAGADFDARLAGRSLRSGWRSSWKDGDEFTMAPRAQAGACAFVALAGGLDVPAVLGARGTDLAGGWGGHQGRALRAGDLLPLGAPSRALQGRLGVMVPALEAGAVRLLRALPGPEHDTHFDADAQARFWTAEWTVGAQSNRMGARLQGPLLPRRRHDELPSHAVGPGAVQVPAQGQPIALRVDAQTTGGYPRIAWVIAADSSRLAQCEAGARLRFQRVTLRQAGDALRQAQQERQALSRALALWA
jgi:biotin-dependent carboxylase-like uncharacterized protein